MEPMNYCAVCGKKHAEIGNCPKYKVPICSAHCEICEYLINKNGTFSLMHCGYNATTKALGIPMYMANEVDIAAETAQMQSWSREEIEERYLKLREEYKVGSPACRMQLSPKLAAMQKMLRDMRDDEIAKGNIPKMSTEDIKEYRRELCRYIAENSGTKRLQRAVRVAIDLCCDELKKRGEER